MVLIILRGVSNIQSTPIDEIRLITLFWDTFQARSTNCFPEELEMINGNKKFNYIRPFNQCYRVLHKAIKAGGMNKIKSNKIKQQFV